MEKYVHDSSILIGQRCFFEMLTAWRADKRENSMEYNDPSTLDTADPAYFASARPQRRVYAFLLYL